MVVNGSIRPPTQMLTIEAIHIVAVEISYRLTIPQKYDSALRFGDVRRRRSPRIEQRNFTLRME